MDTRKGRERSGRSFKSGVREASPRFHWSGDQEQREPPTQTWEGRAFRAQGTGLGQGQLDLSEDGRGQQEQEEGHGQGLAGRLWLSPSRSQVLFGFFSASQEVTGSFRAELGCAVT